MLQILDDKKQSLQPPKKTIPAIAKPSPYSRAKASHAPGIIKCCSD
ncbi:MAG: hypothetical protein V7K67_20360 [Nostoc sp.]